METLYYRHEHYDHVTSYIYLMGALFSAGQSHLEGVKAIQWGIEHEKDAISIYESTTGSKVSPCGLLIAPNGFLGASPDGFVGDSVVLEVKCPWRLKTRTVSELCASDKHFCISQSDSSADDSHGASSNSSYCLKPTHDYYHQVQGQMYLSGRTECHFVIWSPSEHVIIPVKKDPLWQENILKLSEFYSAIVLPRLINELRYIETSTVGTSASAFLVTE